MRDGIAPRASGVISVFQGNDGQWFHEFSQDNAVTYSGMDILAMLLQGENRTINGMYLEFENGTAAADIVTPVLDKKAGVEYYLGLAGNRDYVRIPAGPAAKPGPSSADYTGNRAAFFGSSSHVVGEHGLGFSFSDNTVVFGVALVSLGGTPAEDLIYARAYFEPNLRIEKHEHRQIGIKWTTTIYHPEDTP